MKIALAQMRSVAGNIDSNIQHQLAFVERAADKGATLIVFPELSLTGYEPSLANDLAMHIHDERLAAFAKASDQFSMTILTGAPIAQPASPFIGMVIFQPQQPVQLYTKQYLHADEQPFFSSGAPQPALIGRTGIAAAICYEISIPDHAAHAANLGAVIYLASVAKTNAGVKDAFKRLPAIARQYGMAVLMCNSVGWNDNFDSAGQSASWDDTGELLGQLNDCTEGILLTDMETKQVTKWTI